MNQNTLDPSLKMKFLETLQVRFSKHISRHPDLKWDLVFKRLMEFDHKLWSLYQMEESGGEPDVLQYDSSNGQVVFYDCAPESPKGRRSLCYDQSALESRKDFPPQGSVLAMAEWMGVSLLDETEYRFLQTHGEFDLKTSSWIVTPHPIRTLGGALFADRRYDAVFVYHNGASSYYAARGFRTLLRV